MGFHIHLRGRLEYASVDAAAAAHRDVLATHDWIVEAGARVDGNVLVVSFENFVGDPSNTIDALVAAANSAVAGKLLYDDESGERLQIRAGAIGIGPAAAPGGQRFETPFMLTAPSVASYMHESVMPPRRRFLAGAASDGTELLDASRRSTSMSTWVGHWSSESFALSSMIAGLRATRGSVSRGAAGSTREARTS